MSKIITFFDTETSGKCDFKLPPDHFSQPHLVQLAVLVTDDGNDEVAHANLLVRPEGFEIPDEASAIHGITTEYANRFGVPLKSVLELFKSWVSISSMIVGHNIAYDKLVMDGEYKRVFGETLLSRALSFCTMQASTNVCKLPGKYGKYKWPKLEEAYAFAFNEKLEDTHDALADIRATAKLYRWLQSKNINSP